MKFTIVTGQDADALAALAGIERVEQADYQIVRHADDFVEFIVNDMQPGLPLDNTQIENMERVVEKLAEALLDVMEEMHSRG